LLVSLPVAQTLKRGRRAVASDIRMYVTGGGQKGSDKF
jgi:hypothetical protein